MNTYTATFCNCGRIHIRPDKDIDWMSEDCKTRRVLHVCRNCGATFQLFLTERSTDREKPDFYLNGCDIEHDQDINIESDSDVKYRIHISDGIRVPMTDGQWANYYRNNMFHYIDPETPFARDESSSVDSQKLFTGIRDKYKDDLESADIEEIIKAIKARVSNINKYQISIID